MIKVENFMLLISCQKRQKERKSSYIRRHTGKKVKWHFLWKNILILFVIRRHFYHKGEKVDFSMYSNITDITERSMDIQELLMDTDILVTDYSSTYIDYLLLDRPVVFYNFDYQDYLEHDRGMYCDYEKAAPGYKAETFEALMEEFERLVQGEDHFKEVRRQARDFFYCKEGQGMVGETLLGILKNIK